MTRKEFIEQVKRQLDNFDEFWQEGRETSGMVAFPNELPQSEWYEQFECFIQSGDSTSS